MIIGIVILALVAAFVTLLLVFFTPRDRAVLFQPYATFNHENIERKYLLSLPKNVTAQTDIIIGIHGFTDSARRFAYYTALHNSVNVNDIVVYPKAVPPQKGQLPGWNAGFCCGSGWGQNIDDAGFIQELTDQIKNKYNAKNAEVFAAGFSNGGFMVQKLAVEYPDLLSGAAVASGAIGTEKKRINPKNPLNIFFMHGKQDKTVLIEGGAAVNEPDFKWLSFDEMVDSWESVAVEETIVKATVFDELGHSWKGWRLLNFWNKHTEASKLTMDFFNK